MGIVSRLNSLFRKVNAQEAIEGYEHPDLVETVFRKTIAFQPTKSWNDLAGAKTVLDFGGACGLHYKMAQMPTVRWAVVETPAMVKRASELATDHLRFFTSIKDAANWLGDIDAMHSNGALQYTDDPIKTLHELCELKAKNMLWYRMYLSRAHSRKNTQVSRLIDNGPGRAPPSIQNKIVTYTRTKIPEMAFLNAHTGYHIMERGNDWFNLRLIHIPDTST